MRTLTLFAALLLLGAGSARAQQGNQFHFERLTWQDGLRGNVAIAIAQDSLGFMWIGTPANGLLRYDGHAFTPYRHDPHDPTSLAGDNIQTLYVDRRGTLWVGTWGAGLDRYDPTTDAFFHYRHDPDDPESLGSDQVREILEDEAGRLWLGTYGGGLNRLDPATGRFMRYPYGTENSDAPSGLSHANLRVIHAGRDGALWLGTAGGGLNRFEPETGAFTVYHRDPANPVTLASDDVWSLHEDARRDLWIGTGGNALHRVDPASGSVERFYYDLWKGEASAYTKPGRGAITSIYKDETGMLWVTGSNCCLDRFEPRPDTLISHPLPGILRQSSYNTFYRSRDGTLWFGTNEGLTRLNPTPPKVAFQAFDALTSREPVVTSLHQDEDGIVWIGTEEGLLRFDPATGAESWIDLGPEQDALMVMTIIHQDRRGILWVGTNDKLYSLNRSTGQVTRHRYLPPDAVGGGIMAIQEDRDGYLWVADWGNGLIRRDARTGRFEHYRHDPDDPTSLSSNHPQFLLLARSGTLWVGEGNGFDRFDPQTNSFTHFIPGRDEQEPGVSYDVHVPFEDSRGFIWYGTTHGTGGISRFDPQTGQFTRMSDEDYLAYGFQEDDHGRLWINTDVGILIHELGQEGFSLFGSDQGFDASKAGGFYGALPGYGSYKNAEGKLFIGIAGGYYEFHPDDLLAETKTSPPQVALLSLSVHGRPVKHGDDAPIKAPVWLTDAITLAHHQNTFALTFAALHYRNPGANRLRYRLDDYDAGWRTAGPDRQATYTRVPPGNYVFRVQAATGDGDWNEPGASVRVVVRPPWWQTTWAYVLYGLLFLGGIFAANRVQRRQLIRRERERAQARELEQAREIEQAYHQLEEAHEQLKATQHQLVHAEKMASLGALTAGIAHEIKNPLNFVNNFAELNAELTDELFAELDADPDLRAADLRDVLADMRVNALKIHEQGRRADAIVRAMVQHASGGTGERETVEVNPFVEEYVNLSYHGMRAQVPGFNVEVLRHYDTAAGRAAWVPQEIGRVLINLLNNAFYAVHEQAQSANGTYQPTVTVSTRPVDGGVEIQVSDNGPGIPVAVREKIFEPFYTTKPTGNGTGLGLSLSYEIVVQGHGGTLALETEPAQGAAFVITLPR